MNKALAKHTNYSALDDAIGSDIDGDPLRFKDGVFLRGFDKIEVEEGTTLRIAPTSVQDGYCKWEDGKPIDWRLREWARSDQLPVFRDTLPDAHKIGQSDDPWTYTLLIALRDDDGVQLKFSTGSVGGANAVRKVLREWKRQRDKHPGQVPLVCARLGQLRAQGASEHGGVSDLRDCRLGLLGRGGQGERRGASFMGHGR